MNRRGVRLDEKHWPTSEGAPSRTGQGWLDVHLHSGDLQPGSHPQSHPRCSAPAVCLNAFHTLQTVTSIPNHPHNGTLKRAAEGTLLQNPLVFPQPSRLARCLRAALAGNLRELSDGFGVAFFRGHSQQYPSLIAVLLHSSANHIEFCQSYLG